MDPERYNFKVVEEKWQNYWLENINHSKQK